MTKKIWFLLLSLFVIFWFWISFANPIAIRIPSICSELENVEIDNYRIIIPYIGSQGYTKFYEPNINECLKCVEWGRRDFLNPKSPEVEILLLDKSVDTENVSNDFIRDATISLWFIPTINCSIDYDETRKYEIIKSWNTYKLEMLYTDYNPEPSKSGVKLLHDTEILTPEIEKNNKFTLIQFFIALWIAIVIETIILFAIAKLFWDKDQISNWKIVLFWVLPTTITLPLLWFVLPLLLWEWTLYTIIWELSVIIIESVMIKYWLKISRWKAITVSIICNLCSYLAWLLIL